MTTEARLFEHLRQECRHPTTSRIVLGFILLTVLWGIKFHWLDFSLQTDSFLNLYLHGNASLMKSGWDPYVLGYTHWYPILGAWFPINWIMHGILEYGFDNSPSVVLIALRLQSELFLLIQLISYYALLRFLNRGRWASACGSMVINGSGFLIHSSFRELNTYYQISYFSIPWVIIFLTQAVRHRSMHLVISTGIVIGLSLLGGINTPLFFIYPTLPLVFLLNAGRQQNCLRNLLRSSGYLVIASTIAVALAAIQLLPTLVYKDFSARAQVIEENIIYLKNFSFFLNRLFFNGYTTGYEQIAPFYNPNSCFFLGMPIVLITIYGYLKGKFSQRGQLFFLLLACKSFFVIGIASFPESVQEGFKVYMRLFSLRFNEREFLILLLAVGYGVAGSVDRLQHQAQRWNLFSELKQTFRHSRTQKSFNSKTLLSILLWLIFVILIVFWSWSLSNTITLPKNQEWQTSIISVIVLGGLISIFYLLRIAKVPLLAIILAAYFFSAHPNIIYYGYVFKEDLKQQMQTAFVTPAGEALELAKATNSPFRILRQINHNRNNIWSPRYQMDIAFEPFGDPATPRYLDQYERAFIKINSSQQVTTLLHSPLISLFNVKYIYLANGYGGQRFKQTSLKGYYQNPLAFDRFFITHKIRLVETEDKLWQELNAANHQDLAEQTYLLKEEVDLLIAKLPLGVADNLEQDFIQIQTRTPQLIQLKVGLKQDGLLNAAEIWFPTWKVRVNGQSTPLFRGYGALWAVPLGQGVHEVEFIFDDIYAKIGFWLSLSTFIVLLCYYSVLFMKLNKRIP